VTAVWRGQVVDPNTARDEARNILSDGRFNHSTGPRPLRKPLESVSDKLRPVWERIVDALLWVPWYVWIVIGAAIVALVVAYVVSAIKRRATSAPVARTRKHGFDDNESEDPDELERNADEAERDGDLARAIRLRFRAGLLRLGARGAIAYRPSVTTGEVRRELHSDTFDDLATTFEGVAYGEQVAAPPDVDEARRGWSRVLQEAARK
jgi:Domain of unknown function (DUF4129)